MNIQRINDAIASVCNEIVTSEKKSRYWTMMDEVDYIREAVICVCSSQMRFEVAVAAGNRIASMSALKMMKSYHSSSIKDELNNIFREPLEVNFNNKLRTVFPRFRNRILSYISRSFESFALSGISFRSILDNATTPKEARITLVQNVIGFGPKQASLFLRRVGYSNELAILDTHILDYLKIARGIQPKLSALARISGYEEIEHEFINVASEFNHVVGNVDLAVWITMRVAKRNMAL